MEQHIKSKLKELRLIALSQFMGQLMNILLEEGYSFYDFLSAVTDWVGEKPGTEEAVKHLEAALKELKSCSLEDVENN